MEIGIIVAMDKELSLLLPLLERQSVVSVNGMTFHSGTMYGRKIVAMQCGIGKVNAAIGALSLIENFHVGLVINTGVAGGTGNGAKILDVVIDDKIAYQDEWCGPGTKWGRASGCPDFFECAKAVTSLECLKGDGTIITGLACSGDIFVSRAEEVRRIRSLYPDVLAVDMESAAIAQVCHLKNVPLFCMRVISDTPGEADNIAQYESFWEDAPRHTFELLTAIISNI